MVLCSGATRSTGDRAPVSLFVDTNVLVYARDLSVPAKQQRVDEWMSALWA